MNPMLSALKNRRSSQADDHKTENVHDGDHSKQLHEFVKTLSPEAKEKLHTMLSQDMGGKSSEQIAKGAPSKEEQMKIAQQAQADNGEEGLEQDSTDLDSSGVDSDKIALNMLDTRFKNAPPSKARNLHERVQMGMAKDLKAKGKI